MTTISKTDCGWIYEEYRSKIFGYVSSKIYNRTDVEDVVSSIFLKICKNIEKFDCQKASLSTWIYTITRNTVYDRLKSMRDHPSFELDESMPASESVEDGILAEETLEELAVALERLSQIERDIIISSGPRLCVQ